MSAKSLLPSLWEKPGEQGNPFRDLHKEIDRVFDEFSHGMNRPFGENGGNGGMLSPHMDVSESEDAIDVSVELPGVDEKDVDLSVTDKLLTVKGEKRAETESGEPGNIIVERSYGSFVRSMSLPCEIEVSKVKAKFDKGVLKITLPKPPEAISKAHKIKIKSGN